MRPRPLTILLLLLAGAVVNVGVAWGIAAWAKDPLEPPSTLRRFRTGESAPGRWSIAYTCSGYGQTVIRARHTRWEEGRRSTTEEWRLATGIPWRSLQWIDLRDVTGPTEGFLFGSSFTRPQDPKSAVRVPASLRPRQPPVARFFPLRPAWPGFAYNTLVCSALFWLLFLVAPGQARRHLRARRGLCPACAYPVGESPVCSECGRSVRVSPAASPLSKT